MSLQGLFTNEGITKSIEAENNEGFRIKPILFGVSEEVGDFLQSRDYASMKPRWYTGAISSVVVIDANTLQFNCNIPAGVDTVPKFTREVYLIAEDMSNVQYLLAFSQPSEDLTYDPEGELRLRLQIKIANLNIADLYEFKYTQATEVEDHNQDVNAHPQLQEAMNKAGVYVQASQNRFNGQGFDGFPVKAVAVSDKDAVFFNTVNNRYEQAIDIELDPRRFGIGMYDAPADVVVFNGVIDYPHSLAPFTRIYLSQTIPGGTGIAPSSVTMGFTLPDNKMMVNVSIDQASESVNFDGDLSVTLIPPVIRELTLEDGDGVKWDVKVDGAGLLYTVPNSIRNPDPLFRIPKLDLSSAQITVDTDGVLGVNSPPLIPGLTSDEFFYLLDDNGIAWKLTVNLANEIVTQAYLNAFTVKSELREHFVVKQTDELNAIPYVQVYNATTLPATPPSFTALLPYCLYFNGVTTKPIYHDGSVWRYMADDAEINTPIVPKIRLQRKALDGSKTTSQALPSISFNNLVIGRTYKYKLRARVHTQEGNTLTMSVVNGVDTLLSMSWVGINDDGSYAPYYNEVTFTATATTLAVSMTSTGVTLFGGGVAPSAPTWAELEETDQLEFITDYT